MKLLTKLEIRSRSINNIGSMNDIAWWNGFTFFAFAAWPLLHSRSFFNSLWKYFSNVYVLINHIFFWVFRCINLYICINI